MAQLIFEKKEKMNKIPTILFLICLPMVSILAQQSVAINTDGSTAHQSAILHVKSTDRGILIPRTDTASIGSPAVGLLIFQNSDETFYYKNANRWVALGSGAILKDKDEDTMIEVERTADDDLIRFSIAGQPVWTMDGKQLIPKGTGGSLFIGQGAGLNENLNNRHNTFLGDSTGFTTIISQRNVAVGSKALKSNTTGNYHVAIGERALEENEDGRANVAVGRLSLSSNLSGDYNTAVGTNSLLSNTSGSLNTAVGRQALLDNTGGERNVAVGQASLKSNTDGDENIAIGRALQQNTTGSSNIAIGNYALNDNDYRNHLIAIGDSALAANVSGRESVAIGTNAGRLSDADENTFLGYDAGKSTTSGFQNVFVGASSGIGNTTADYNTFVGAQTGDGNGWKNTLIGSFAGRKTLDGYRNVAVGSSALDILEEPLPLFGFSNSFRNVAIGDSALWGARQPGGPPLNLSVTGSEHNVAVGSKAMFSIYGISNVAVGSFAGGNASGDRNIFLGRNSFANGNGDETIVIGTDAAIDANLNNSVIIGVNAASNDNNGNGGMVIVGKNGDFNGQATNCVLIGYQADLFQAANQSPYQNAVAIGYNASATGNDKVRIGNASMNSIGGFESWTNLSDGRFKENVTEDVVGLDFIMGLRPVTYNLDMENLTDVLKEDIEEDEHGRTYTRIPSQAEMDSRAKKAAKTYSGFIAQEVEELAGSLDYDFSGVDHPDDHDLYGLRYAEFVVPLTKALQEQQAMIEELRAELVLLKTQLNKE